MSASKPKERGNMIRDAKAKQGYCGTCDARPPQGRVTAEELWVKNQARPYGFVRINER